MALTRKLALIIAALPFLMQSPAHADSLCVKLLKYEPYSCSNPCNTPGVIVEGGCPKPSKIGTLGMKIGAWLGNDSDRLGLAQSYRCGNPAVGIEKNPKETVRLYDLAAKDGVLFAQNALAMIYLLGDGASQDLSKAAFWYLKTAQTSRPLNEIPIPPGSLPLECLYYFGEGIQKDYSESYFWYAVRTAGQTGYPVIVDPKQQLTAHEIEAVDKRVYRWFDERTRSGNILAEWMLGELLAQGKGTQQNWHDAYYHMRHAQQRGREQWRGFHPFGYFPSIEGRLKDVAGHLTVEEAKAVDAKLAN